MPERDSANDWQSNQQSASADVTDTTADASQQHLQNLPAELTSPIDLKQEAGEKVPAEPHRDVSITQDQDPSERVRQLEQALDESQAQVSELRSQLSEQQMLETQLAATEEVANLQQMALAQLKYQLTCEQQALKDQIARSQVKEESVRELLATLETLATTQQLEIESLRSQLNNNRTAVRTSQKQLEKQLIQRQTDLESQQQRVQQLESQLLATRTLAVALEVQLTEQEQHIKSLYDRLGDRAYYLNQIEAQLQQAHDALEAQQDLHTSLTQTQALSREQNTTIANLQRKIELLETQMGHHIARGARLQQACGELTESSERASARSLELEGELSTLQEQILMQAQQASEYEAAIQYWKEQYSASQHQAQQLKEVLERLLSDRPNEILELLMAVKLPESSISVTSSQPSKQLQVDLPAFLRKTLPN